MFSKRLFVSFDTFFHKSATFSIARRPRPGRPSAELPQRDRGKAGDVTVARTWTFPPGSVVVADRAYLDFKWLHHLREQGVTFVTRLKRGVKYRVLHDHDVNIRTGVMSDQTNRVDQCAWPQGLS